ncbi:MAG: TfoX family protein [Gemmatimonadetes bacterium]|nr:TfoX family protein [Gemmatimonadota bacterium]
MAFDEKLAKRIRKTLGKKRGLVEKKMFGGIAFLLNGNMCVGVHKDALIARVDAAETDTLLKEKDTRHFDLTGRPMKGWILVGPGGVATDAGLGKWVMRCVAYAGALPKK